MKSVAWKSCILPLSIIEFWSLWWDQPSIERHSCSCLCFASSNLTHEGWSPEACSASKPRVCCSSLQASTPPRLEGAVSGQRHQIWPCKGQFLFSQQRIPLLTLLHFSFSVASWWYVPFTLNKWSYTSGRKPIWALSTYFPTILCVVGPFRAEGSDGTMIGVPRLLGRYTLPTTPFPFYLPIPFIFQHQPHLTQKPSLYKNTAKIHFLAPVVRDRLRLESSEQSQLASSFIHSNAH